MAAPGGFSIYAIRADRQRTSLRAGEHNGPHCGPLCFHRPRTTRPFIFPSRRKDI